MRTWLDFNINISFSIYFSSFIRKFTYIAAYVLFGKEGKTFRKIITFEGLPLRPLVLFTSMADLIDLYWSGAGQDKTTLLQVMFRDQGCTLKIFTFNFSPKL